MHILLFASLAALARLALPGMPWLRLLLWLVLFSAVSELVQFWAPGREPRWSDVANDLGVVEVGLAPVAAWAAYRHLSATRATKQDAS